MPLLVLPVPAGNGAEQFLSVVSDSVLEHDFGVFNFSDIARGVPLDHDHVCALSSLDRANAGLLAFVNCAVQSGDPDSFDGRDPRFDQQLDFALTADPGEYPAVAGRIRTCQ